MKNKPVTIRLKSGNYHAGDLVKILGSGATIRFEGNIGIIDEGVILKPYLEIISAETYHFDTPPADHNGGSVIRWDGPKAARKDKTTPPFWSKNWRRKP